MDINPSNALNGLHLQSKRIAAAADNIIKQTTKPEDIKETDPSLEDSVVDIADAKVGYKANAKVIKAEDDMLKSLLDIIV